MRLLHDEEKFPFKIPLLERTTEIGSCKIIEFNPAWINEEGLMTNLAPWVEANMEFGETVRGVRWLGYKALPFVIRRDGPRGTEYLASGHFRGEFEMENGDMLHVEPGKISFWDPRTKKLVRCYYEYLWTEGTTWKLDVELRRVYERNYHDCPAILAYAYNHIDSMLYSMTRVPNKHMRLFLPLLGPKGPYHHDLKGAKPTPLVIQKVYAYVRDHYFALMTRSQNDPPDIELFERFKEAMRQILLGIDDPAPMFAIPLTEVSVPSTPDFHGQ